MYLIQNTQKDNTNHKYEFLSSALKYIISVERVTTRKTFNLVSLFFFALSTAIFGKYSDAR